MQQLQQPGAGDSNPDLSEQYLRLSAAFLRRGPRLATAAGGSTAAAACASLAEACALTAASCCGSNHKRVAILALGTLGAAVAAALEEGLFGEALRRALLGHGERLVAALVAALLGPSPLPRVQKVSSLLLALAGLAADAGNVAVNCSAASSCSGASTAAAASGAAAAAAGTRAMECSGEAPGGAGMRWWLAAALQRLPGGLLKDGEGQALVTDLSGLLAAHTRAAASRAATAATAGGWPANGFDDGSAMAQDGRPPVTAVAGRSYLVSRKLKKALRDFAERHNRAE